MMGSVEREAARSGHSRSGRARVLALRTGLCLTTLGVGCYDNATYGEGSPCSASKPCRAPLVCEKGRCTLPEGGAAGVASTRGAGSQGGDASAETSSGGSSHGPADAGHRDGTGGGSGGATPETEAGGSGGLGGSHEAGGSSGPAGSTAGGGLLELGGSFPGADSPNVGGVETVPGAAGSVAGSCTQSAGSGGMLETGGAPSAGGTLDPAGEGGVGGAGSGGFVGGMGGEQETGGTPSSGGSEETGGAAGVGGAAGAAGASGKLTALSLCANKWNTCAVVADRTVRCWGNDCNGQLGIGRTSVCEQDVFVSEPVEVAGISGARAVAAGVGHTCALLETGEVWCWGLGSWGQLGDGSYNPISGPVKVELSTSAEALTLGGYHGCALLTDTTVECWGFNAYEQLGGGDPDADHYVAHPQTVVTNWEPTPAALEQVAAIAALNDHTCATRSDQSVYCWGYNTSGQLGNHDTSDSGLAVRAQGVEAAAVAVGQDHSCALDEGGAVSCWGDDTYGQLGNGAGTSSQSPVSVQLSGAASRVASGWYHTCAVLEGDGTAYCWGDNEYGAIGDGSYENERPSPQQVSGLSAVTAIAAGEEHTCAIVETAENSGAVYCWGDGWLGRLGNGSEKDQFVPALVRGF